MNQEERGISRLVIIGVTGIVALLAINAGLAYRHLTQLQRNGQDVSHSQELLAQISALRQLLIDAETGYRGYLIAGKEEFLDTYEEAVEQFPKRLEAVKRLTQEDPPQSARLAILEQPMREALANMEVGIRIFKTPEEGGPEKAHERLAGGEGRKRMAAIRDAVQEMVQAELQILAEKRQQAQQALRIGLTSNFLGAAIGLAAVIAFVWQLDRAIRAQRRSAAAIHEQRQLLHATLTSIGDGVLATDAKGMVTFLNGVAEKLTGWRQEEAKGAPLEKVFHIINETTREKVENPAERALREGAIVGLANHTILIARDGSERPIDDSAAPIWNERCELAGAVLVFRDITDRKKGEREAEEQLRFTKLNAEIGDALTSRNNSEEMLQACVDSLLRNLQGALVRTWIFAPPKHWKQPSATAGDAAAPSWLTAGRLDEENGWTAKVSRQPRAQFLELLSEERDEEVREWAREQGIVAAAACPLRVQERRIGVVALFSRHPIGARALHALEVAAGAMALGIERSAMEEKLREYVADLSDADRRKDEFLATLAHELRNPLAPMRNGLQLLRLTGGLNADAEATRAMMERQIEQMVRLVDDLMDVSRITRGKLELRRERVLLSEVVGNAIETARPLIEEMGHELQLCLPEEPIPLYADRVRLAQVFSNLLTNSAKYMERGGLIQLWATQERDQVVVRVRDQGVGISEDHLPQIFQMFSQLDRSLHQAQGGLGIGLSLVKRLTEMHGGEIEAQSDGAGKGAEFIVRLPMLKENAPAAPNGEEKRQLHKSSMRILVVDDNRDGADSLSLMLRLMGNETFAAYDGEEGVQKAEELRPDVVLLDIGLPKLNGYEACARIREREWGKDLILIAITGWGQDEDRRRSQEAGFNYHLVKPVDPHAFSKLLAELSRGKAERNPAPPQA